MPSAITLKSTDGISLEGKLWLPTPSGKSSEVCLRLPTILFVHQLGKLGGSAMMMNGMAANMASKGFQCITFNLRGIGRSEGYSTWTCKSEQNDVKSAISYIINDLDRDVFLVGSSAGASLADYSPRVKGGLLIGMTWGFFSSILFGWAYSHIQKSEKPKLFVIGDRDEFTTMSQYSRRFAQLRGTANVMKVIEGKNHFEIESPAYDDTVCNWLEEFIFNHVYKDGM